MKLTCVTAVYNAIKSGNRENLIRCVRSVAALKTEHEKRLTRRGASEAERKEQFVEHLIYDGGSTDGTVELLRELEAEVRVKSSSSRADGLRSCCGNEPCRGGEGVDGRAASMRPPRGGESGALGDRALPGGESRGGRIGWGRIRRAHRARPTGWNRPSGLCQVAEWFAWVDEAAVKEAGIADVNASENIVNYLREELCRK